MGQKWSQLLFIGIKNICPLFSDPKHVEWVKMRPLNQESFLKHFRSVACFLLILLLCGAGRVPRGSMSTSWGSLPAESRPVLCLMQVGVSTSVGSLQLEDSVKPDVGIYLWLFSCPSLRSTETYWLRAENTDFALIFIPSSERWRWLLSSEFFLWCFHR